MCKIQTFSILLLFLLLLSGCQPSPDKTLVISKNDGSFDAALNATVEDDTTQPKNLQCHEEFTSTDGSVKFNLNIDKAIVNQILPVVTVVPRPITSEDSERVARILLGDTQFYEREPSVNPQYSKRDYQKAISLLSEYSNMDALADLLGPGTALEMMNSVKQYISLYTEKMESAPEENPHTLCDWKLKKERVYNDSEEYDIRNRPIEDDGDVLFAKAEKDGITYGFYVFSKDTGTYVLNRIVLNVESIFAFNFDQYVNRAKLLRTNKPTEEQIAAAKEKVQKILDATGLGDWKVTSAYVIKDYQGSEPEYTIRVIAGPVFQGLPALTETLPTEKYNAFVSVYAPTSADFEISAYGDIVWAEIDSPIYVQDVVNAAVATIPFPQLIERAQAQLVLSDAGYYGLSVNQIEYLEKQFNESISCVIDICHLEYGLGRIATPNADNTYYYVPVLMLSGNVLYQGDSTGTIYYESSEAAPQSLLWVNAVDGTIIAQ